ncbi:MAG: type III-E CRISPR-associated protein Csx30, partial [Desulfococcaceae bacterium]|nr:type III-E CRISPR-associated protein Csx30 [Desulfococcaceae bacterium]
MENQHEYDFLYSPGTDFLIMWGSHMLERPEMTEEAEILSDTLGTWDKSALRNDIAQTYALVLQEKENAKSFFASHPFLPCHFADELWNDAAEMLRAFDHVLYLWLAADEIFKDAASEVTAALEKAYEDICEWTDHSENFTGLRLVPLNEMRQSRLESIPEKSHYLYPWYADLSGVSADALDLIAENWNSVRTGGYESLSFLPENDRPLVWDCLKNDKGLVAELDVRLYADKIILETIENSVSLRLFQIAKDYALKTDIPDKIAKA